MTLLRKYILLPKIESMYIPTQCKNTHQYSIGTSYCKTKIYPSLIRLA